MYNEKTDELYFNYKKETESDWKTFTTTNAIEYEFHLNTRINEGYQVEE